jgi:uncharacterized protein (DUF305 family)
MNVVAALVAVGLGVGCVFAQEHAATPPAPCAEDSTNTQLFDQNDLLFLSHMIRHHEQALELGALVPSRTERDELVRFARYIDGAQRAEIEQMKSLLRLATERGMEIPEHAMHGDPPMAGMLSKAQMAEIAGARGAKFERLWLEGMILHHEGAVSMARAQQERQFENGRRPYGIDVLVEDILDVQRAEISEMRSRLANWGLSSRR